MEEKYINEIIKLSKKAIKYNSVPVGAIVVKNNKVISRGYNKKEKTKNPMDHAEIIAIKKACSKMKSWNLKGCLLYVTMSPCGMCKNVANEARIENIYYLIDNTKEKYKNNKSLQKMKIVGVDSSENQKKYLNILRDFFWEKRKKITQKF